MEEECHWLTSRLTSLVYLGVHCWLPQTTTASAALQLSQLRRVQHCLSTGKPLCPLWYLDPRNLEAQRMGVVFLHLEPLHLDALLSGL
jgi:hypothetical protein